MCRSAAAQIQMCAGSRRVGARAPAIGDEILGLHLEAGIAQGEQDDVARGAALIERTALHGIDQVARQFDGKFVDEGARGPGRRDCAFRTNNGFGSGGWGGEG